MFSSFSSENMRLNDLNCVHAFSDFACGFPLWTKFAVFQNEQTLIIYNPSNKLIQNKFWIINNSFEEILVTRHRWQVTGIASSNLSSPLPATGITTATTPTGHRYYHLLMHHHYPHWP